VTIRKHFDGEIVINKRPGFLLVRLARGADKNTKAMDRLLRKEPSVSHLIEELDSFAGEANNGIWDLSKYGLTLQFYRTLGLVLFCYVNYPTQTLQDESSGSGGMMSMDDTLRLVQALKLQQETIYVKPLSIRLLEQVTGIRATLATTIGRWYLQNTIVSLFNNTYNLSLGYSDGVDNFEVFFMDNKEPLEYVKLPNLLRLLEKKSLIVNRCMQCEDYTKLMKHCRGSCSKTSRSYYCDVECQKMHWVQHKSVCHK
jgi:hypothetical protein